MCPDLMLLHQKLVVKFDNEDGIDYGGLSREWMYEISHQILNPQYCLFVTRGSLNDYIFEINPLSSMMPDFKQNFNFVGRMIGLALFHLRFLDCSFSKIFYKQILNQPCTYEDIQQIDIEFYNSVDWLIKNNIEEAGLDMYFCMEMEYFGDVRVIEFKPDGRNIKVTEENKHDYIDLLVDWKIHFETREQMRYIIHGISEIIPLTWLRCFSIKEFEMLLCGIQDYDLDDWKKHTRYSTYDRDSIQIKWFWEFVQSLSSEDRGKLLHFVTGTTRVPSTGFKDLMGSTGVQQFMIQKWGTEKVLPRSHTCFNRLDLPPYTSYEQLQSKLMIAMQEVGHYIQ
ncbi:E3 ubiquitin-protein ligase Itchy [Thelohanellus kitauei]|uniref:HECT-type E3 ubiquitin transferase n=1 Tax=Thelohanellus kitauei TaxID=669202 RepID=A0A0C2MZL7_THEKT|nr:E3 ubiquitin-protein ligase Itchy [Thelohanellus kitauei]